MKNKEQAKTPKGSDSEDTWNESLEHQEPALTRRREMLLCKCTSKRKRTDTGESSSTQSQPQPPQGTKKEHDTQRSPSSPDRELLNQFVEDNSERCIKKRRISPVPVQPILVPDHLRGCFTSGSYIPPPRKERLQQSSEPSKDCNGENAPSTTPIRNWSDPLLDPDYEEDIFANLRETEMETLPSPSYTSDDTNDEDGVTWTARDVFIDWLIEVHFNMELLPETLFLAVNIIDRYFSKKTIASDDLQLLGVTALLIAAKFEEGVSPPLKYFLLMTDDQTLTQKDLITSESRVLQVLDYRICFANPLNFLRRMSKTGVYDLHSRMLSKYLIEISCVDHRFIGIPPSKIAAAALWLTQYMRAIDTWTQEVEQLSGYTVAEVEPIVLLMLDFLAGPVIHDSLFNKWSCRQLEMVSLFARKWVAQMEW